MIEKFICVRCGKSDVIDGIKVPQENTMLTLCDECREILKIRESYVDMLSEPYIAEGSDNNDT